VLPDYPLQAFVDQGINLIDVGQIAISLGSCHWDIRACVVSIGACTYHNNRLIPMRPKFMFYGQATCSPIDEGLTMSRTAQTGPSIL